MSLEQGIRTARRSVRPRKAVRKSSREQCLAEWSGIAWVFDEVDRVQRIEFGEEGRRLPYGLHGMVAALAGEGNYVIVDDVIAPLQWSAIVHRIRIAPTAAPA